MNDQTNQHPRRLPPAVRGRTQDKSRDGLIIGATLELLGERGYHGLTMTDVAARAGVSKATLYRRWKVKADLVADAVATLDSLNPPRYSGTSLRDDLLALMKQAGNCDDRSEIVTATMEMARSQPDLYRTLSERFSLFVRTELAKLVGQASDAGIKPLSAVQLDVLGDTIVALLAHYAGPSGSAVPHEHLIKFVDHVIMVLITGDRSVD
jgi:Transcriptional regulator